MTIPPERDVSDRMSSHVRRACRAVAKPPTPWPPATGLADHRLIFFAAKPAIDVLAQSRVAMVFSVFERGARGTVRSAGSRGMQQANMSKEGKGENVRALVLACDELGERLSPDELAAVRATGQLPAWFVPAMHAHAREIRRQWRR